MTSPSEPDRFEWPRGKRDDHSCVEQLRIQLSAATARIAEMEGAPKINAVALVKMFRDQRDECADALREMVSQFAAYSISGDREQALKKARAALIKVPTYEQRLQNVCDGLGISREQLTAALAAPSPDVSER